MFAKKVLLTALVVGAVGGSRSAQAADDYFNGINTSGAYETPGNSSSGALPSGGNGIVADTATLSSNAGSSPTTLYIGGAGTASGPANST